MTTGLVSGISNKIWLHVRFGMGPMKMLQGKETPKTLFSKNLTAFFIIARVWNQETLSLRLSSTIADLKPPFGLGIKRQ